MLKKIKIFTNEIFKPMPLDDNFSDYDEYWTNRGFHAPSLQRAKLISNYIEPNSKILDIGCGDGTVMQYLNDNNHPSKIVGIDISDQAITYVKNKGYDAFAMDVLSNEFSKYINNNKFDYIIITEVLEHVQDPEIVINLIKDRYNKKVFVSVPNAGYYLHRIRLATGRFPLVMIVQHTKEHIRFWTKKDFYYWAAYHGYKIDNLIVASGIQKVIAPNGILSRPFKLIENTSPGLFANQLIYELSRKE